MTALTEHDSLEPVTLSVGNEDVDEENGYEKDDRLEVWAKRQFTSSMNSSASGDLTILDSLSKKRVRGWWMIQATMTRAGTTPTAI